VEASHQSLAHGLARLALGVNIALHGYTRLPGLEGFSGGLQKQFAGTFLPGSLVYVTGYGIAIGEAVIGTLILLGLFLRPALAAGMLLMTLLLFGVCLIQKWDIAGLQMIYVGYYAILLATLQYDRYSLDAWRRG
jgi:thiosulfate dehydrogenase (quinone) large subunit